MSSESFGASLVDDCLFNDDFFANQSPPLDLFNFGIESTNIDNLMEQFEEQLQREKANKEKNSSMAKNCNISNNVTVTLKPKKSKIIKISPLKAKSTTRKKGISLLAKPKNNVSHVSKSDLQAFSYLLQDHDYCLVYKENQNQLYHNKLPDYITSFNHESCLLNDDNSEYYDKIPNYLKDYLSNSDSNISNEMLSTNEEDILIELNEASIEMSEQFFEDSLSLFDTNDQSNEIENLLSDVSDYLNSESQISKLEDIEKNVIIPQECEQLIEHNQNVGMQSSIRISRSRSRDSLKTYTNSNNNNNSDSSRRRKMSTRSSVDSLSRSSRSSSCSSCSSCLSFSSRDSDKTNLTFKSSNIIRSDNKEQQYSKKRSLKESYCQKNFKNTNFKSKYDSQNKRFINNNVHKVRTSLVKHTFEKDIEERKIVYVGKIPDGTTKTQLRHWFGIFGAIKEVSIHFRDHGDNYAFVTFLRKSDAYEAIEHANDDSRHPKFDLSFGGRRQFCKTYYEDLDYAEDNSAFNSNMDFDSLLKSTRAKLIS